MDALQRLNEVMGRIEKAEVYMDEPYNERLTGKALEDAIQEREKFIPKLQELMREATKLKNIIDNQYTEEDI